MFPSSFPEANQVFDKPDDLTHEECGPIDTFTGVDQNNRVVIVTCWKPTLDELEEIVKTGRVWCFHWGNHLQPHSIAGHNPFQQDPQDQQ